MVATDVLAPNMAFAELASDERIERTAAALEANGFHTIVVATGDEAKAQVLELLPDGAEVFDSTSQTLATIGLAEEIAQSARYQAIRPKLMELLAQGDRDGMRQIGAAPAIIVGSVHAITEQGQLLVGSGTGSQLGPYAYSGGRVIWVVGAQKLVRDLDEGLRRLREYSFPLEDARVRQLYGMPSSLSKILIINRESQPERATVILVKEQLGF